MGRPDPRGRPEGRIEAAVDQNRPSQLAGRNAASVAVQKARNVTPALTAWEYSHCRRSARQLSGRTDQFSVTVLTGWVQITKMARLITISAAAAHARMSASRSARTASASATLRIKAAGSN